jgi:hypothetical protein
MAHQASATHDDVSWSHVAAKISRALPSNIELIGPTDTPNEQ